MSHPLRIDEVAIDGVSGLIGLTFCPGKIQKGALSGPWERDLKVDLEVIRAQNSSESILCFGRVFF
jgi:ADP-ribosyl-[dinitrogen reductase] hydrolase